MPSDTAWPVQEITSWTQLLEFFGRLNVGPAARPNYVFRGQANARWGLESSLYRRARSLNDWDAITSLERVLRDEFVSQAGQHVATEVLGSFENQLQKWAVMQHHGAPTRLLDWKRSPFVATYYAVDSAWEEDGAIWLFHEESLRVHNRRTFPRVEDNYASKAFEPNAPEAVVTWQPSILTDRMSAQQGLFTLPVNPMSSHEVSLSALRSIHDTGALAFQKLVVPARLKPSFLRSLRVMNISANALFPGVDGLGRSVAELLHLSTGHGQGVPGG